LWEFKTHYTSTSDKIQATNFYMDAVAAKTPKKVDAGHHFQETKASHYKAQPSSILRQKYQHANYTFSFE
jgi:hypothetical protein